MWNPLAVPTFVQVLCGLILLACGTFPRKDIVEKEVFEENNVKLDIVEKDIAEQDKELKEAMAAIVCFQNGMFIFIGIFLLLVATTGYFVLVRKSVLIDMICVFSNVSVILLQLTVLLIFQGTNFQKQFHTVVLLIFSLAVFSSVVCVLIVLSKCYSDEDKIYSKDKTEIRGVGHGSLSALYFSSEVYTI